MKRIHLIQIFYKTILAILLFLFVYFLIFSDIGLIKYFSVKKQVNEQFLALKTLKQEIKELENELVTWKTDPFCLEKAAREELCMGHPDEIIYLKKEK